MISAGAFGSGSSSRPSAPRLCLRAFPNQLAEPLLDALNLRHFFAAVIGPELDSENQRKGVTLERAMREFAPEANPVMVGDRKHDIAAAHEHKLRAIGVLWGIGSEAELRTAKADALARSPRRARNPAHFLDIGRTEVIDGVDVAVRLKIPENGIGRVTRHAL